MARELGATSRGVVTVALTWPPIIAYLLTLGLPTVASVVVGRGREHEGEFLGFVLVYLVVIVTPASIVIAEYLPRVFSTEAQRYVQWLLRLIPFGVLFEILAACAVARGRYRLFNTSRYLGPAVLLISLIALERMGHFTVENCVIVILISNLLPTLLLTVTAGWAYISRPGSAWLDQVQLGLKYHIGGLFGLLNLRLDTLIISLIAPLSTVGIYSVANNACVPLSTLGLAANAHVAPLAARWERDSSLSRCSVFLKVRRLANQFGALASGGAVIIFAVAPFVPWLFGTSFRGAVPVVRILAIGYAFRVFAGVIVSGANGLQKSSAGNLSELIAILFTIPLLLVLLPRYGALGAAIASLCAYASSAVVARVLLARWLRHGRAKAPG